MSKMIEKDVNTQYNIEMNLRKHTKTRCAKYV